MKRIIGIDFGTSNCSVSAIEGKRPVLISNDKGSVYTPSVVYIAENGSYYTGEDAKSQAILYPGRVISNIKRQLGKLSDVRIAGIQYSVQEIAARILIQLKNDAEKFLGSKVPEVVITVPANFSDTERKAIMQSGEIAGFNVRRIINEPTAAAMAADLETGVDEKILVYDFGGGTIDISILEISDGLFEVRATAGRSDIGGVDFDSMIAEKIIADFKNASGIDIKGDPVALQKVRDEAERVKIALSDSTEVSSKIPFLSADARGPQHLSWNITRGEFERMIQSKIDETFVLAKKCIADSGIKTDDIDAVLPVGGTVKIPVIQKRLKDFFTCKILQPPDPAELVALGAGMQAGIIEGSIRGKALVDVTPLSLGIEIDGGYLIRLIERNTPVPVSKSRMFTTISDNQRIVEIHVLQGEHPHADQNISLGRFYLEDIPPEKKGMPRIEVIFEIDIDGILHVSALNLDTGKRQTIRIAETLGLSEAEIKRMMRRAMQSKKI